MPHFVIFGLIIYLIVHYWQAIVIFAMLAVVWGVITNIYDAFMTLDTVTRYIIGGGIAFVIWLIIRFFEWCWTPSKEEVAQKAGWAKEAAEMAEKRAEQQEHDRHFAGLNAEFDRQWANGTYGLDGKLGGCGKPDCIICQKAKVYWQAHPNDFPPENS